MTNTLRKTKKEMILENVHRDPYLKIENLAQKAQTTPCYVRTILSEANISLMKLRKEYARKMENFQMKDKVLFSHLLNTPFKTVNIVMDQNFIFNNTYDLKNLSANINKNYYKKSFRFTLNSGIWCVNTIIMHKEVFFCEHKHGTDFKKITSMINNYLKTEDVNISSINLEIEEANKQMANILRIDLLSPLLRIKQVITLDHKTKILMLSYFNPRLISLSLSVNSGLLIERKGGNGK